MAGHARAVSRERGRLPRHAPVQVAESAPVRGGDRGVEVSAVQRQTGGGGVPRGAAAILRDGLQQSGGEGGVAQQQGGVRAGDGGGPGIAGRSGALITGDPGAGLGGAALHLQSHGGGHGAEPRTSTGGGDERAEGAPPRGGQPTGALQEQPQRIVHHVLGDDLGGQRGVARPRDLPHSSQETGDAPLIH